MIESGFAALFGHIAPVYPVYLPDDRSGDAIVYRLLSETPGPTSHSNAGTIIGHHFQFTGHSTTRAGARAIVDQIQEVLNPDNKGFRGIIGGKKIGWVEVTNFYDVGYFPDYKSWQFMVTAMFNEEK